MNIFSNMLRGKYINMVQEVVIFVGSLDVTYLPTMLLSTDWQRATSLCSSVYLKKLNWASKAIPPCTPPPV